MQTFIHEALRNTSQGKEAERILRSCVHCGFCTATCPTYQLLGDELDGPRGRIYLIKSLVEGQSASDKTMQHLDRCLTCRSCETTCPSGVEYGKLLDIGRRQVEKKYDRPVLQKLYRQLILWILPYRSRFRVLLRAGQLFRFILPARMKRMIPAYQKNEHVQTGKDFKRKVILLSGCVQSSLAPEINSAVKRILNKLDVSIVEIEDENCCGAMNHHLGEDKQSTGFMKKNIDLLSLIIEQQNIEAIISTASGCGVHIKEYGYLLRDDPGYAEKAEKISLLTADIAEYIDKLDLQSRIDKQNMNNINKVIAFQSPCTLQHGQKLNGVVEKLLTGLGYTLVSVKDAHLCCGSAGVYSLLQKNISDELRRRKLTHLLQDKPELILTANIGCREHLNQQSPIPVRHWAEEVAELLE